MAIQTLVSPPESSRIYGVTKERNGAVIHGWRATPKAVCWERNEYTILNEAGQKDATLESEFYSKMDNDLNIAIKEIVALVKENIVPNIDEEDRMLLAHSLVIDAARRNPDYKDVTTSAALEADFKSSILNRIPEKFTLEDAEAVYDKLAADPIHMKLTTNKSRRSLLSKGVKTLTAKPFRYIFPPDGKTFVLGNPLVRPKGAYIVPIDPQVAMLFRAADGPLIGTLTRESRKKINKDIFSASSRVIATSDCYLRVLSGKQGKSLTFTSETDRPSKSLSEYKQTLR